jgi:NAD+ diphosphatase
MPYDIHPIRKNIFAGGLHDRLDARRKDTAWIAAQLEADNARFLPVWRTRNLVAGPADATPDIAFLPAYMARAMLPTMPWALLGSTGEHIIFAIDLSSLDQPLPPELEARFEELRHLGAVLPEPEAALLAHARGLMQWRVRHRFCGVCGAACTAQDAGHVMACNGCGAHHFPRTDPAVIMLVTHGDRVLLGQPARFRDWRVFTTLAGFVEPLEEAVAREVAEEAGIRVANVRYHSSQPWPFPASIMLGFTAEAITTEIAFDPHELVTARWFTREELRAPDGFALPPGLSIARRLINDWIEGP